MRATLSTGLALSGLRPLELMGGCAAIGDHTVPGRLEQMPATAVARTGVEHDAAALVRDEYLDGHLDDEGTNHPAPVSDELAWGSQSPAGGAHR
ncbi:hypothetical protein [Kineococcus sp. SYSU DK004]|uniref:hypothetical protein n=1 Tax=Kineococcus sp. SYSU DK004 TaxID=3383125 RepID=UPI003D7D0C56